MTTFSFLPVPLSYTQLYLYTVHWYETPIELTPFQLADADSPVFSKNICPSLAGNARLPLTSNFGFSNGFSSFLITVTPRFSHRLVPSAETKRLRSIGDFVISVVPFWFRLKGICLVLKSRAVLVESMSSNCWFTVCFIMANSMKDCFMSSNEGSGYLDSVMNRMLGTPYSSAIVFSVAISSAV